MRRVASGATASSAHCPAPTKPNPTIKPNPAQPSDLSEPWRGVRGLQRRLNCGVLILQIPVASALLCLMPLFAKVARPVKFGSQDSNQRGGMGVVNCPVSQLRDTPLNLFSVKNGRKNVLAYRWRRSKVRFGSFTFAVSAYERYWKSLL